MEERVVGLINSRDRTTTADQLAKVFLVSFAPKLYVELFFIIRYEKNQINTSTVNWTFAIEPPQTRVLYAYQVCSDISICVLY